MGFDGTLPGVGEARLIAIRDLIRSKIGILNTALARDAETSFLLSDPFPTQLVAADCVVVGDADTLWDISKGSVRVCVTSGGQKSGLDFSVDWNRLPDAAWIGQDIVYTTGIYAYLHPERLVLADAHDAVSKYEIARERISDWLRAGVFNARFEDPVNKNYSPHELVLSSKEVNGTDYDRLTQCFAKAGYKDIFMKSMGSSEGVYAVHMIHTGMIQR